MAENLRSALVVDDSELLGVVSFKCTIQRALARELQLKVTGASSIMTSNPETVLPDTTMNNA